MPKILGPRRRWQAAGRISSRVERWVGMFSKGSTSVVLTLLVLLLAATLALSGVACGPRGSQPTPTPTAMATLEPGWTWKSGDFIDYSLSGMPDFDQRQDQWEDSQGYWSYCGPVAEANSLWWLDSEFEPSPIAPPTINDNYPFVQSYLAGQRDDHDTSNVGSLVEDLAMRMDTDGQASGGQWSGTFVEKMHTAVNQYLIDKGLQALAYAHMEKSPEFSWIVQEVERCQDVVLLLGFWQLHGEDWVRIGGHYVTCAGVNADAQQVGVSDPYWDCAEGGALGRVPVAHTYPHAVSVHNDAQYVSHDVYDVVSSQSPGGKWALEGYADGKDITNFIDQNWADDLLGFRGAYDPDLPIHTEIDYAVGVSPIEGVTPVPTPTPTPVAVPTPTPTPTPTGGGPVGTPTTTPTTPAETPTPEGTTPAATPTPPPPTPDPSVPVVTGIRTTHSTDPVTGHLVVQVHCIPAYFPQGTNIYDLHFFTQDGQYLGSTYFETPMEPCTWYNVELEVPEGADTEFVIVYLTDENHDIWGQFAFYNRDVAAEEIKSPTGVQEVGPSDTVTPTVAVRNFGSETVSFTVMYHLEAQETSGLEYLEDEISVQNLPSGEAIDVVFPPVAAETFLFLGGEVFEGVIYFETYLEGDEVEFNDFIDGEFTVVQTPE